MSARLSKPLGVGQVATYYTRDYGAVASQSYHAASAASPGQWHGRLATELGLVGDIALPHFLALAKGQHPTLGGDLLRKSGAYTYIDKKTGKEKKAKARRAGWDFVLSPEKGTSAAALVGGDHRIIDLHDRACRLVADYFEAYVDARMGGSRSPINTGKWVAATFRHDSARPVDGFSAPQVHTHIVIMNVSVVVDPQHPERGEQFRSVQSKELYGAQHLMERIYQSYMDVGMRELGYTVARGKSKEAKVMGFTDEYLELLSPRRKEIVDAMARLGTRGAAAAELAALATRSTKIQQTPQQILDINRAMAREYGDQPATVVAEALARSHNRTIWIGDQNAQAKDAVEFARKKGMEREAVPDHDTVLKHALYRGQGYTTIEHIHPELDRRIAAGHFLERTPSVGRTKGRALTTPEMVAAETQIVEIWRSTRGSMAPLGEVAIPTHFTDGQRHAIEQIADTTDKISALHGKAGTGKTYVIEVVAAAARRGFVVQGLAPTGNAAVQLARTGIPAHTLQYHVARGSHEATDLRARYYVLDEAGLADTDLLRDTMARLRPQDRLLLVGDIRQHQAVKAGIPFEILMRSGMATVDLNQIMRQKDPGQRRAAEELSVGQTAAALDRLDAMGKIKAIARDDDRLKYVVDWFLQDPPLTRVYSADNETRREVNVAVHQALQAARSVGADYAPTLVLVPVQDMYTADREKADMYQPGQVVRYQKTTQHFKVGTYATVMASDRATNHLTVQTPSGKQVTYDPSRLHGVDVYDLETRAFANGDRVQFTAKNTGLGVINRDMGTLQNLDNGRATVLLDRTGKSVVFPVDKFQHIDLSYAQTTYIGQGQTVPRSLLLVNTTRANEKITNARHTYVGLTRQMYDLMVVTDDLGRCKSKLTGGYTERIAMNPEPPMYAMKASPPSPCVVP